VGQYRYDYGPKKDNQMADLETRTEEIREAIETLRDYWHLAMASPWHAACNKSECHPEEDTETAAEIIMTKVLFECDYCDGEVVLSTEPGRSYDYRTRITLELPEGFATATCQSCGSSYLNAEEAEKLERHFETQVADECWRRY
jgi:transcription elongation factor Elf1